MSFAASSSFGSHGSSQNSSFYYAASSVQPSGYYTGNGSITSANTSYVPAQSHVASSLEFSAPGSVNDTSITTIASGGGGGDHSSATLSSMHSSLPHGYTLAPPVAPWPPVSFFAPPAFASMMAAPQPYGATLMHAGTQHVLAPYSPVPAQVAPAAVALASAGARSPRSRERAERTAARDGLLEHVLHAYEQAPIYLASGPVVATGGTSADRLVHELLDQLGDLEARYNAALDASLDASAVAAANTSVGVVSPIKAAAAAGVGAAAQADGGAGLELARAQRENSILAEALRAAQAERDAHKARADTLARALDDARSQVAALEGIVDDLAKKRRQ